MATSFSASKTISNSLVHREYSSSKPARLVIEKDRLWADNANRAAFHGLITPENVQPVPKNPILASFFKQIGNADELGSGTRNLFRYVRLYSGLDPILDEEDQFKVTIPLDDTHNPEHSSHCSGLTTGLTTGLKSKLDRDILAFLEHNPSGTMSAIAERLGKARSVVAEHMRNLKAAGLLVREGGRARGAWRVAPHGQHKEND